jgi:tetrahydromethanopterin S-methyltransferase subunit B
VQTGVLNERKENTKMRRFMWGAVAGLIVVAILMLLLAFVFPMQGAQETAARAHILAVAV